MIKSKFQLICENAHGVLIIIFLCIAVFETNLKIIPIWNFLLLALAKLPQRHLLSAAVSSVLFTVCDCHWESFPPLCIITLYCHIKRERNQNWLFVQLYWLIFHHGQTEFSPLIHKNLPPPFFLLEPWSYWILAYLCLTLFVILTSLILGILKNYMCVVFMNIHFYLCLFVCFLLCHTAGFFVGGFLVFKSIYILVGTDCFLPMFWIYKSITRK